jgi:hypothetical protein
MLQVSVSQPRVAGFDELVALLRGHVRVRRLSGRLRVAIVRHLRAIAPEIIAQLARALVPLAEKLFPNNRDWSQWFKGEAQVGLFSARDQFFLVGSSDGAIVGFSSFCTISTKPHAIFIDVTGILPEYRGRLAIHHLYWPTIAKARLRRPTRMLHLLDATRNPAVYHMQVASLGVANVFPKPGVRPPNVVKDLGERLGHWCIEWRRAVGQTQAMRYDPEPMILRGYFPEPDRMPARDPEIERWFEASLGPRDAFVVVCRAKILNAIIFSLKRMAWPARQASRV